MLVEVEGPMGVTPPSTISLRGPEGTFGVPVAAAATAIVSDKLGEAKDGCKKDTTVDGEETNKK